MNRFMQNLYPYVYLIGWIVMWVIHVPHLRKSLDTSGTEREGETKDKLLVLLLFLGTSVLPLISILTPWLDRFAFQNPPWLGPIATTLLVAGLIVLHLGHRDLSAKYSQDLEIKEELEAWPETLCRGGSAVYSPLGELLAGPLWDQEGIVYADLDMGEVARGKFDFDVTGHYARPDVFQFFVNQEEQPPVDLGDE